MNVFVMSLYSTQVRLVLRTYVNNRNIRSFVSRTCDFFHRDAITVNNQNEPREKECRQKFNSLNDISRDFCTLDVKKTPNGLSDGSESVPDNVLDKVMYNSILAEKTMNLTWGAKVRLKKFEAIAEKERRKRSLDTPYSLKYLDDNIDMQTISHDETKTADTTILPYQKKFTYKSSDVSNITDGVKFYSDRSIDAKIDLSEAVESSKNWMKNYEFFQEENESDEYRYNKNKFINYGTPDRSVSMSQVPCGGCGAFLHCQDTGLPGYLPSELFKKCTIAELRSLKCQRCHFLEKYNIALNLSVSAEEYPLLLSRLKNEFALAIVLVDITDFPCSLWPGIIDIIGRKRPVVVVANKIDLLPRDSPDFLAHARSWFENAVHQSELAAANIKYITLISAQTGFGIESLITKLFTHWEYKGDVYLLGCTNVGKSTLFNALLRSDYCKVQAVDVVQRATTSPWPGTTLNLLKFPIMRPQGYRLYQRVLRLQALQRHIHIEEKLLREQMKKKNDPYQATFIGHLAVTHRDLNQASVGLDPFSVRPSESGGAVNRIGLNPNDKEFVKGKWCYDTPGTIHPEQIIDIITAQELITLLPREMILPRTFQLRAGDTLLVAGVGRIDFVGGTEKCRFTVFAARSVPISVCRTVDTDIVYNALAASNLLKVPSSGRERLAQWPNLAPHSETMEITGCKAKESAADIVLSSAGWVSITPDVGETCRIKAWTPFAKGIFLRQPALMRFSVKLRGLKVRKSPAYLMGKAVCV